MFGEGPDGNDPSRTHLNQGMGASYEFDVRTNLRTMERLVLLALCWHRAGRSRVWVGAIRINRLEHQGSDPCC
jgi:hypothetical protein